jgi:hypothetical protein
MAENDLLRVSTRDGKYTVIQQSGGGMRFERNGEDWLAANEQFVHVGLILALAQDLEAANKVAETVEKLLQSTDYADDNRPLMHNVRAALEEWNQDRKKGK